MEKEIKKILEYWYGVASPTAINQILSLLDDKDIVVLHDKVVKQVTDEYKGQISRTIKKHYR